MNLPLPFPLAFIQKLRLLEHALHQPSLRERFHLGMLTFRFPLCPGEIQIQFNFSIN